MRIPQRLKSLRRRSLAAIGAAGAVALAAVAWALPPRYAMSLLVLVVLLFGIGAVAVLDRRLRTQRAASALIDPKANRRLESIQAAIWGRKRQLTKVGEQLHKLKRAQDRLAKRLGEASLKPAHDESLAERIDTLSATVEALADAQSELSREIIATNAQVRDRLSRMEADRAGERIRRESEALLVSLEEEISLIADSILFDADWYRAQVPEPVENASAHYVTVGAALGLAPHPLFDPSWYLERNRSALVRYRSPLAHLLAGGPDVVADVHPAFDEPWYSATYLEKEAGVPAILHYLAVGEALGHNPNRLFDSSWYRSEYSVRLDEGVNAFVHYMTKGAAAGSRPHPLFDPALVEEAIPRGCKDLLSRAVLRQRELESRGWPLPERPREADWQWFSLASGKHLQKDTFALYRIIGNDLPPRHSPDQTLSNLEFMLKFEPAFDDCRKIWVLNRIVDPEQEERIRELLERYSAEYLVIPFDADEYRRIGWNFERLGPEGTFTAQFRSRYVGSAFEKAIEHVYHYKNLYVMNNNGARNVALRHGRDIAKWVLPWDGNCFLTEETWSALRKTIQERPHLRYLVVPMARLTTSNETFLSAETDIAATEEPQLVFRDDSRAEFHPDFRYGHRPKVELLRRLGVPGAWDKFNTLSWEIPFTRDESEQNAWAWSSKVYRLYSGSAVLESNATRRRLSRHEAILAYIDGIDEAVARQSFRAGSMSVMDEEALKLQAKRYREGEPVLSEVVGRLVAHAERLLAGPVASVMSKTTLPPSGDPHDFWVPASHWWPAPGDGDDIPYILDESRHVPGTRGGEPESERYDRAALRNMIDTVHICTLAATFSGEERFYDRAVEQLRVWFLTPATRMNPHLDYAHVRLGHNENRGHGSAVMETRDFYYLLDAVRLLGREGRLTPKETAGLRKWFREFRAWLEESPQGRQASTRADRSGLWYDVQAAAIDFFLDDVRGALKTMRRVFERVGQQFDSADGSLRKELLASDSLHQCAETIVGWSLLNGFAARLGLDLAGFVHPSGASLRKGLDWMFSRARMPWPYEQVGRFDADRMRAVEYRYGLLPVEDAAKSNQLLQPESGVRPYWMLGEPPITDDEGALVETAPLLIAQSVAEVEGPPRQTPDFLHVFATRHGIGVFDEDWFEYRQRMFELLTLASVEAQTSQAFVWVIGIDRAMPESARKRLEAMVGEHPNIELLEVELKRDFRLDLARWVRKEGRRRGADWVMTTRIDDDDVIHTGLVERLQEEARNFLALGRGGPAAISAVSGCRWIPRERLARRVFHHSLGLGLSTIEQVEGARTVYYYNHMSIMDSVFAQGGYIKCIGDDTSWWMYSISRISDQQAVNPDRYDKLAEHKKTFFVDDETLRLYGMESGHLAALARVPEPVLADIPEQLTKRGLDLEAVIHRLRTELKHGKDLEESERQRIRDEIAMLHRQRRELHQGLVKKDIALPEKQS